MSTRVNVALPPKLWCLLEASFWYDLVGRRKDALKPGVDAAF